MEKYSCVNCPPTFANAYLWYSHVDAPVVLAYVKIEILIFNLHMTSFREFSPKTTIFGSKFFQEVCQCISKIDHTLSRYSYLWSRSPSRNCLRNLLNQRATLLKEQLNMHESQFYVLNYLGWKISAPLLMCKACLEFLPSRIGLEHFPSNPCNIFDCLLSSFPISAYHLPEHCLDLVDLKMYSIRHVKRLNMWYAFYGQFGPNLAH